MAANDLYKTISDYNINSLKSRILNKKINRTTLVNIKYICEVRKMFKKLNSLFNINQL